MVRLARSVAKGVADLQCRPVRNSRRKTRKFSLLTSGIEKRPLAGGHKESASVDVGLLHCPIIFGFELRIHFVQCKSLESVNLITMVGSLCSTPRSRSSTILVWYGSATRLTPDLNFVSHRTLVHDLADSNSSSHPMESGLRWELRPCCVMVSSKALANGAL
jgi:hypothetical protein